MNDATGPAIARCPNLWPNGHTTYQPARGVGFITPAPRCNLRNGHQGEHQHRDGYATWTWK